MNNNDRSLLGFFVLIGLPLVILFMAFTGEFSRYGGHNGYSFAWKDFRSSHLHLSDLNKDGEVSSKEKKAVKMSFLKRNELYVVSGNYQVYSEGSGEKVSAEDFVKIFKEDLKTTHEIDYKDSLTDTLKSVLIHKLK